MEQANLTSVVKLVVFDVDGTLIRTHGAGVKAFERTFASEFGHPNATQGLNFAGRTDPSIVREVFQKCSIPATDANFRRFFEAYVFWLDYLLSKSEGEICVGVWNFLSVLRALPHPPLVGLLTGNISLGAEIKLRHFQLWDLFTLGAFGDDHEDRNKLAGIARDRAVQKLGIPLNGSDIVVVGDTPLDIACARAIHAKTLAVGTGGFTVEELKPYGADWLVQDLNELSASEVCA